MIINKTFIVRSRARIPLGQVSRTVSLLKDQAKCRGRTRFHLSFVSHCSSRDLRCTRPWTWSGLGQLLGPSVASRCPSFFTVALGFGSARARARFLELNVVPHCHGFVRVRARFLRAQRPSFPPGFVPIVLGPGSEHDRGRFLGSLVVPHCP